MQETSQAQSETESNKAVIRRFVDEVQNKKNWDAYDELNHPEFVNLSAPPGIPSDREGGKLYLAAYALGLGATGLTFFDDDVTRFFSPHAAGKSVMFLDAIGHPARRAS